MQLHEMIERAVERVNSSERDPFNGGSDALDSVLIDAILSEISEDRGSIDVSHSELLSRAWNILAEIDQSQSDPVSLFHQRINTELQNLESEESGITVYFPVNFIYREECVFSLPVTVSDVTFERIESDEWEEYVNSTDESSAYAGFVEDLPVRGSDSDPFRTQRFWKATVRAADQQFAVDTVSGALSILLGKIALASNYRRLTTRLNSSSWNQGQATLRGPLGYFTSVDSEPIGVYSNGDYDPREEYTLGPGSRQRFNDVYPHLPNFNSPNDEVETYLMTGFSAFYSAITEPSNEQALLNYWRCLEATTFTTDSGYSSDEPLWRAHSVAWSVEYELAEVTIDRLSSKRNRLVHRGGPVSVDDTDLTILKSLAEGALIYVVERKVDSSIEDMKFILDCGSKSEESLIQSQSSRRDCIDDSLSSIEKWKHEMDLIDTALNLNH